jgi:hypothetical protein
MGCVEGKMKEHVRYKSTKPLVSEIPGEITVGNIMFVELKHDMKKPMLVHGDVNTKLVTGHGLSNKSQEECTRSILNIKQDYQLKERKMKTLVFDQEPAVVPTETMLKDQIGAESCGTKSRIG